MMRYRRRNPQQSITLVLAAVLGAWAYSAAGKGLFGVSAQGQQQKLDAWLTSKGIYGSAAGGPLPSVGALPMPATHYLSQGSPWSIL